ncbi:MAG: NAD(P)H-binding protein [Pseudomonadota bacterium]|nr:NAD(P)H-binding protein [Pseudomonadota bacterium]
MTVVLLAATGRAGRALLTELTSRGHEVVAVARSLDRLPAGLPASVRPVRFDLTQDDGLAEILAGADAVISAFGPSSADPRYTTDIAYTDQLVEATSRAVQAVKASGAGRLVVVGGAGSLEFAPGVSVLDSGKWPAPYVNIATSHVKAFALLRASDINWTYFSPPMSITPGERTGVFRLGGDQVIRDEAGNNRISFEDYAVALVDELETPRHERARFTVAY